jgi:hypothetical protein
MDALVAEVASLRAQLQQLKSTRRKDPCQGLTGKGTPCRNGACVGSAYCRMHGRDPRPPRPTRAPRVPKPVKIIPTHTHALDSRDPLCPLCETHGDCMDPTLPEHEFECLGDEVCGTSTISSAL